MPLSKVELILTNKDEKDISHSQQNTMKSLKSFTAKKRYDLTVFNHAAGNSELLVINDIALSSIEKRWFENIFRQCKDSVIGFALKKSPRFLDKHQTLDDVLTTLEESLVLVDKTISRRMELEKTMRSAGFNSFTDIWETGDGQRRVFIKVTGVAEINNVMSLIAKDYPELKEEDFHIGSNCLWIFERHLYYEEKVTQAIPFINRQKAAKLLGCNEDCISFNASCL